MLVPGIRTVVALALVGFAACMGSGDEGAADEGEAIATASTTAEASSERRSSGDACALLTEQEVSAAAGVAVEARGDSKGGNTTSCSWYSGETPVLQLDVTWQGGREEWSMWSAGFGLAATLMAESEADRPMVDSIVKPGPVAHLGDQAFFSDIVPSFVLKDDILLAFMMQLVPDADTHFEPLARKALSRI
jgi:hypothetical protein